MLRLNSEALFDSNAIGTAQTACVHRPIRQTSPNCTRNPLGFVYRHSVPFQELSMPVTDGSSSSTSQSLLDGVRRFENEAWERFARIYSPLLYRWGRQAGLQEHDAADVAQEVFRAVARHIADFRREKPDDSFRGWIWTITRNKVRDHYRIQTTRPAGIGGAEAEWNASAIVDPLSESLSDESAAEAEQSVVHEAIQLVRDEFEPRTWEVFTRLAVDGHDPGQVAAEFGMTMGAVYTAKSRVLRRLRQELDGLL